MIGIATLIFEEKCGVITKIREFVQDEDLTNHYPSIGYGDLGDDATYFRGEGLFSQLAQGNTWLQVMPESDLPYIGILAGEHWEQNPNDATKWFEHMVRVGYDPICIKEKMTGSKRSPMIFPGLARWLLGWNFADCLYDIGGESNSAYLTPEEDISEWYVVVRYSDTQLPPSRDNRKIALSFKNDLTHAVADSANTRGIFYPPILFPLNSNLAYSCYLTVALSNTDTGAICILGYDRRGREVGYHPVMIAQANYSPLIELAYAEALGLRVSVSSDGIGNGVVDDQSRINLIAGGERT